MRYKEKLPDYRGTNLQKDVWPNKYQYADGYRDRNKAVYTTAPVAGGWAGAVMNWAGACSNTNFPTLNMPKNAKKAKCDRPTDGPTDTVTYRPRARDKKSQNDS